MRRIALIAIVWLCWTTPAWAQTTTPTTSATPTVSATPTPTTSRTATPTATKTATATSTTTISPTTSPTPTTTISASPTISATISATPSLTPTATPTAIGNCPLSFSGVSPPFTSLWPITQSSGTTIADVIDSNNGTISGGYTFEPAQTYSLNCGGSCISTSCGGGSCIATATIPVQNIGIGDSILVAGISNPSINGMWTVTSVSGKQVGFNGPGGILAGSGGTLTDTKGNGVFCNPSSGNGCNISTVQNYTNPQPFSFAFAFSGNVGGIVQFGSVSSQTAPLTFYEAYLDNFGRLTVGVNNYGLDYVIQSALPYSDGNKHVAIVTLGGMGMRLYVDGFLVAKRNVQLANYTSGFWFFGGMNPSGWPYSPSSAYFNGTLYCLGWWNGTQLADFAAEQITAPFPPPIPNNYCSFTGNIASFAQPPGYAYANQRVTLQTFSTQGPQCGGTSPIAPSSQSYTTDSQGNLPSGILIQQGAHFNMSIGLGQPIPMVAPCSTSCPLANFFPTPTPTPTATTSTTPTPSSTPTLTATPTATPSPTVLACASGGQQIAFPVTCNGNTAITLSVRAGDSLYFAMGGQSTPRSVLTFISDNQGDTWNANDVLNYQGGINSLNQEAAIGSTFNATGGITTVTITTVGGFTAACDLNGYLIETPPTNNLDVTATNQSVSTSPFDSGTTPGTVAGQEFALAIAGQSAGALGSGPTNGFAELNDPSNNQSYAACNVVPINTAVDTKWTPQAFAGAYAAGVAVYKIVATATSTSSGSPTATPSATPTPNPMFVQQAGTAISSTSIQPSFANPVNIGDTVVLFFNSRSAGSADTLTVTGLGASWINLGCNNYTSVQQCEYAGVATSAGQTVVVSGTNNLAATATIAEYSGMPLSITQDGSVQACNTGSCLGSTINSGPFNTGHPHDLVLCNAGYLAGSFPSSPSAPFINLTAQDFFSASVAGQGTYQIVTNTGSFQPSWGNHGATAYVAECAAIEY